MNYLKKKIKAPSGQNSSSNNKDLEDDLYDEYVVEAPPHPSELLALGVNPEEIDVNDPDKLRELYKKAKDEGKVGKVNSVLLAKQREKELIEQNKKTKEEWKFFDSLSARVELAVKESQKTLEQLKDTSAIEKLQEPEYEFIPEKEAEKSKNVKPGKSTHQWIDFGQTTSSSKVRGQGEIDKNMSSGGESNRRASDVARNPFAASRVNSTDAANKSSRLYHRNMSSFEAASLHMEHQLQLKQQNQTVGVIDVIDSDLGESNDLIAKMTADFKSAIETNDKQFTTNPFENFDPFETIIDDDISFPSPPPPNAQQALANDSGKQSTSTSTASAPTTTKSKNLDQNELNKESRGAAFFNPFETVVDKDALQSPTEAGIEGDELRLTNDKVVMDDVGQDELDQEAQAELLKAPNPTPMHKPSCKQGADKIPDCNSVSPTAAVKLNQAGESKQESTSIESVVENTNLDGGESSQREPTGEKREKNHESNEKKQTPSAAPEKSAKESRFKGPSEFCALPRPKPSPRRLPPDQAVAVAATAAAATTSGQPMMISRTPLKKKAGASKKKQSKRKSSFQEDSSDSSEEDDRIQIFIKASEAGPRFETGSDGGTEAGEKRDAFVVPLLPPPPSKSAIMKMNRDREEQLSEELGQADSAAGGRAAVNKIDSFEDLPIGHKEVADDGAKIEKTTEKEEEEEEENKIDKQERDEQDDDGDDVEDKFIIPMNLKDDYDDDDEYNKPETPLYDEDMSYQLEDFPSKYEGDGWEMMLRYPPKKKLTSNRFWKRIFVRLAQVADTSSSSSIPASAKKDSPNNGGGQQAQTCVVLQIFDKREDKKPMQEIPIQATYTVSDISSQQFDQFGKIFTIKLQYIFYKERVGVRQGQLARFIHSGHIGSSTTSGGHGVDPISIGSLKKIGAPIEHSAQVSQIIKLGCCDYGDIKQFKNCLEDFLFKIPISRDRALTNYKTEEVQMACRDETYLELNHLGQILKQLARVRIFFLSFLNGMPQVEVGINDISRQGKEIVGRMDILPVMTEEWIRLEACELHSIVDKDEFFTDNGTKLIRLTPPDATFVELLRFRVRPPRNRELPLQITSNMSVTRTKVSINCQVMIPGCVSRKHGQIPCENIAIRVAIPDCWIYFFREEKHFRMGSKKSVNKRPGKVKGIERFLGGGSSNLTLNSTTSKLDELGEANLDGGCLIEVTSGQAKYEHHHKAIVWRAARWPKDNQSAYIQNSMKIRLPLTAYDKMPDSFYEYVHVEYTMPSSTVSHTTLRSISVSPCDDEPPEKYVKYSAKYEYKARMKMSINLNRAGGGGNSASEPAEASPIVIMKQADLQGDLQKEEDSFDDSDDDDDDE